MRMRASATMTILLLAACGGGGGGGTNQGGAGQGGEGGQGGATHEGCRADVVPSACSAAAHCDRGNPVVCPEVADLQPHCELAPFVCDGPRRLFCCP
ncbi:MAG: hypothetical protein HUU26_13175 [Gemmatimonadaceae bacterium]|nr:hypothetical protein [Polyangiaceae bacterium]NUQ13258.1 hypothetical protein [Gemmatimonadaceae bacterium]